MLDQNMNPMDETEYQDDFAPIASEDEMPDQMPDMGMDMEESQESSSEMLAEALAHFLGDIVSMYHIVHGYHWNVKGKDFKEFHAFFEDIYTDVADAEDRIAEYIVALGFDAPYFPADFAELTCFQNIDRITSGDIMEMAQSILEMNKQMIEETKSLFDIATAAKENGIANFLADRQDAHTKWGWQLRATFGMH
jgi:starvation-inducible DNA-binding protein